VILLKEKLIAVDGVLTVIGTAACDRPRAAAVPVRRMARPHDDGWGARSAYAQTRPVHHQ